MRMFGVKQWQTYVEVAIDHHHHVHRSIFNTHSFLRFVTQHDPLYYSRF